VRRPRCGRGSRRSRRAPRPSGGDGSLGAGSRPTRSARDSRRPSGWCSTGKRAGRRVLTFGAEQGHAVSGSRASACPWALRRSRAKTRERDTTPRARSARRGRGRAGT
jgi:hypothetical protein